MNRDQFLDALAVLVQRHEETNGAVGISQAEATALLELYDAGAIKENTLPLPFEESTQGPITQLTLGRAVETVAAEAASMAVIEETGVVPATALNAPPSSRTRVAQEAMELFDRDVGDLAERVLQGDLRGRDWHSQMIVRLRQNLLQQAQLGKGAPLTPGELDDLQETMREQAQFLKRFADEVAARNELGENAEEVARRRLKKRARKAAQDEATDAADDVADEILEEATDGRVGDIVNESGDVDVPDKAVDRLAEDLRGRPMTEDEIAARARQYKGEAYGKYWEKSEEQIDDSGVVIDYVAVDDGATCTPCSTAEDEGPYLPGQGPMPGMICLGGGHCRCVRQQREAPELAADLRGE